MAFETYKVRRLPRNRVFRTRRKNLNAMLSRGASRSSSYAVRTGCFTLGDAYVLGEDRISVKLKKVFPTCGR